MNKEKINFTNPDELIVEQGEYHHQKLSGLAQKIEQQFNQEELSRIFSPEVSLKLEEFVTENSARLETALDQFYAGLLKTKSAHSPGHDAPHLINNINSGLLAFEEMPTLTESEKLEIILSCLTHDLGRFAEPKLKQLIDKKQLAVLIPAFMGRMFEKDIMKLPEELNLRILYDIWSNGQPLTGYPTADLVHQCDREQLIGPAIICRGLAFDVGIDGRDLAIPLIEDLKYRLPFPETKDDRHWLIQYEFFMRNLYPLVSPSGADKADVLKKENTVILLLALEDKSAEYLEQVFGPELGLLDKNDPKVHWTKKPLSPEIFSEASSEKESFLEWTRKNNLEYRDDIPWLVDLAKQIIATEKNDLPPDFDIILNDKLEKCSPLERKNTWLILIYTLKKRHEKRLTDLAKLHQAQLKNKGTTAVATNWLIRDLEDREKILFEDKNLSEIFVQ